jgi:predicted transport protein
MPLYNQKNDKLSKIKSQVFKLEKEIQTLTENNLQGLFGLSLVKSEFQLNGLRIDSLAFDKENRSFVVIEYKRDKNFSVIDQGYAYLSLMLNNKADFILEYNENCDDSLKRDDVDWSQSRVVFISPSFSKYQQQAINFKDLPIELWEITKYENNLVQYSKLKSPESSESINKITKNDTMAKKVSEEIKVYTENDHLANCSEEVKSLYDELKTKILSFSDEIEIVPKKKYVAFKMHRNFVDVLPQKNKIKLWLNLSKGSLNDPYNRARDVSLVGHWGNGDYELTVKSSDDFLEVIALIKQSFEKNM